MYYNSIYGVRIYHTHLPNSGMRPTAYIVSIGFKFKTNEKHEYQLK